MKNKGVKKSTGPAFRFAKSTVKAHTRKLPSGKTVLVREHRRKGDKHEKPAAGYDPVADYQQNGTRSRAFKAWFGDWEHDPENASKVVDQETGEPAETYDIPGTGSKVKSKDGKPVVVYHGTARGGFEAFDKSKVNPHSLYGPGFYFTEDFGVAEAYQSKGDESKFVRDGRLIDTDAAISEDQKQIVREWLAEYELNGPKHTVHRYGIVSRIRRDLENDSLDNASILYAMWEAYKGREMAQTEAAKQANSDKYDAIEDLAGRLGYDFVPAGLNGETKAVYLSIRNPLWVDAVTDEEIARLAEIIGEMAPEWPTEKTFAFPKRMSAKEVKAAAAKIIYGEIQAGNIDYASWGSVYRDFAESASFTDKQAICGYLHSMNNEGSLKGKFGHLYEVTGEKTNTPPFPSHAQDAETPEDWVNRVGEDFSADIFNLISHIAPYTKGALNYPSGVPALLQAAGYDGITHIGGDRMGGGHHHRVWIAFEPTQIKAVENAGTFDPSQESIYKGLSPGRRFLFATKRPTPRRGAAVLQKGVVQKKATTRRTKSGEIVQVKAHTEQRKDAKPKYGFEKPDPTKRPKGAKLEEMSLRTSRSVWDYDQADSRRYGGHVFVRRDRKKSIMLDDDQLKQMENGEAVKWGFKGTANGTFQADWSRYHERIAKEKKQAEWEAGREQREAEARAERDKLRRAICAEATGRSLEEYLREFTKPSNNPYGYSREWIVLNHRAKVFEAARAGYDVPQARFDEYPDIMKKPRSEAGRKKAVATLMADAGVPKREVAQVLSDRKLPDTENMAEAAQAMVHFWEFSRERKSLGTWCHADDGSRLLVRDLEPIRKGRIRAHVRNVGGKAIQVSATWRKDPGARPRRKESPTVLQERAMHPAAMEQRQPEVERFPVTTPDGEHLLVRRFGKGAKQDFAIHNDAGDHVASLRVEIDKDGAHITHSMVKTHWHEGKALHQNLLGWLVSRHGAVFSPPRMTHDLEEQFLFMGGAYEVTPERNIDGDVRYRLERKQAKLFEVEQAPVDREEEPQMSLFQMSTNRRFLFRKAATQRVNVKGSQHRTKAGKVVTQPAHRSTRKKAAPKAEAPAQPIPTGQIVQIPLAQVRPDPDQHRKHFGAREMQELADSIKETKGNLDPVKVRPVEGGGKVKYQIIDGERRYRASKMAGMKTVRAIVQDDLSDEDALAQQVISNLNRVNVTPTEEATAYRQLADGEIARAKRRKKWQGMDFKDWDVREKLENLGRAYAAKKTGKERTRVNYYIVLNDLPDEVKEMVDRGHLTPAHAHALLRLTSPKEDIGVRDPKVRKEREQHLVRMARHARAHSLAATVLNGMVTEYIRANQQRSMFSDEEVTGGEKQVRRQEQKAQLNRVLDAVRDVIEKTYNERKAEFTVDALTPSDLQVALQQVQGAMATFDELKGVVEREMLAREAMEATKRRVTRPTEPSESEREEAPKQTMSLFSSLRMALERAVARNG